VRRILVGGVVSRGLCARGLDVSILFLFGDREGVVVRARLTGCRCEFGVDYDNDGGDGGTGAGSDGGYDVYDNVDVGHSGADAVNGGGDGYCDYLAVTGTADDKYAYADGICADLDFHFDAATAVVVYECWGPVPSDFVFD